MTSGERNQMPLLEIDLNVILMPSNIDDEGSQQVASIESQNHQLPDLNFATEESFLADLHFSSSSQVIESSNQFLFDLNKEPEEYTDTGVSIGVVEPNLSTGNIFLQSRFQ